MPRRHLTVVAAAAVAGRDAEAEAESEQLRDQLRQLEQDTFDLRRQVAQASGDNGSSKEQ